MPRTDQTDELRVVGMRWEEFIVDFKRRWQPGEHVVMVGPTGVGKTTSAAHVLNLRKYVLATDPKGGDSTLGELVKMGFERVSKWPLPNEYKTDIEEGKPCRLIVGISLQTEKDFDQLRELLRKTYSGAFESGGWTLYCDELQIASDQMGLRKQLERILIAGRDRGVSFISSFQAPRWVPRAASDQATHMWVWYTRDDDVVKRLAEMMGRPKDEVREAVAGLGRLDHSVIVTSRNPSVPMLVTVPPKL